MRLPDDHVPPGSGNPAASTPPTPPSIALDDYELIREIGRGGMAIVYLVRERATGIERAVKVIHTKYLGDEEALARFDREGQLVAQLDHPSIVATHSVKWIDGVGYGLVMDHVPGRTLKQILRDDPPMPFERAQRILDDIAAGLGYAHEHGIVHRDVKPENIFVDDATGRAKLADFGIARSILDGTQVTMAGVAIGTPTYMAPEQIDGSPVDARSDLYSLGLVGWEMVTGRRPWDGETLYNVIFRQKHDQLPAIHALRPDTPVRLAYAIEGLLEKSAADRWQSAEKFRAELASTAPVTWKPAQHNLPAADETIAIAIPPAIRVRGRLRRVAPAGAFAALVVGATLLFARPEPPWRAGTGNTTQNSATRNAAAHSNAALYSPSHIYGVADMLAAGAASAGGIAADDSTPDESDQEDIAQPTTGSLVAPKVTTPVAGQSQTIAPAATPVALPNKTATAAAPEAHLTVSAGGAHTCLINSSGSTYCWGANNAGQLGDGATLAAAAPTPVAGAEHFTRISTGLSHTCALTAHGDAFCWGNNDHGQLGDGSHAAHDVPSRITLARPLTSIASGAGFSCGLARDGIAYCWGSGTRGQLGNGSDTDQANPAMVSPAVAFTTLAAGWNHICALTVAGRAYCWGANDAGQLGDGTSTDRAIPTPVHTTLRFNSISAGSAHTCGTTNASVVYCWGDNRFGQLGNGTQSSRSTPVAVNADTKFVAVSVGSVHTCALAATHEIWCWGRNTYGQLGDGTEASQSVPVLVSGNHEFASVTAFGSHTCGTTTSGDLFCWGYNLDGQLGDGTRDHKLRPTYIERPTT